MISARCVIIILELHVKVAAVTVYIKHRRRVIPESIFKITKEKRKPIRLGKYYRQLIN